VEYATRGFPRGRGQAALDADRKGCSGASRYDEHQTGLPTSLRTRKSWLAILQVIHPRPWSRQWWTLSAPSRWVMGMSVTGPGMAASLDRGHSDLRSGDNEFVKAADPSVCLGKQHGLLGGPPRLTRARSGASGHGLLPSRDSQKVWNLRAGKTARPQLCPQAVVRTLRGMSEAGQGVERDLGDRAQRLLTGVGFPQGFDAAKDSQ
jgi:hypothetical protein